MEHKVSWERFAETGRVNDYLDYRNVVTNGKQDERGEGTYRVDRDGDSRLSYQGVRQENRVVDKGAWKDFRVCARSKET